MLWQLGVNQIVLYRIPNSAPFTQPPWFTSVVSLPALFAAFDCHDCNLHEVAYFATLVHCCSLLLVSLMPFWHLYLMSDLTLLNLRLQSVYEVFIVAYYFAALCCCIRCIFLHLTRLYFTNTKWNVKPKFCLVQEKQVLEREEYVCWALNATSV